MAKLFFKVNFSILFPALILEYEIKQLTCIGGIIQ